MNDISFRKAKRREALQLSILLKTVNVWTYAREGISSETANYITQRFSPPYIEGIIEKNPDSLLVAYKKEKPIGVAEIIHTATCPIRDIKMPELSKLYVLDWFHGQGIGYQLLKRVEEALLSLGYNELYLEVYTENTLAIAFYERQTYRKIGKVDFPMQDNTYQNWVMTKSLIH